MVDNPVTKYSFKTGLFGFKKSDVLRYISHLEEKQKDLECLLETSVKQLRDMICDLKDDHKKTYGRTIDMVRFLGHTMENIIELENQNAELISQINRLKSNLQPQNAGQTAIETKKKQEHQEVFQNEQITRKAEQTETETQALTVQGETKQAALKSNAGEKEQLQRQNFPPISYKAFSGSGQNTYLSESDELKFQNEKLKKSNEALISYYASLKSMSYLKKQMFEKQLREICENCRKQLSAADSYNRQLDILKHEHKELSKLKFELERQIVLLKQISKRT